MVTMQWWDNLWLNEGFASWMESKPVAKWKPEWRFPEDDASEMDRTLNLDSQATTRTIRAKAETPDEINEMFDGIAYGKAGAVIGMMEHYLGEEVFRQGVHNYLAAHLYANATAEDFWNAQTETSHKPIDVMMKSFVTQPGVPLLRFSQGNGNGNGNGNGSGVPVAQSRFFLANPKNTSTAQQWSLPVCVKGKSRAECRVLSPGESSVAAGAGELFYGNADAKGYYRTAYAPEQLKAITAKAETSLTAPERIGLVGDQWALVRAGDGSLGDYLSLVAAMKTDTSGTLINSMYDKLRWINGHIASEEDRALLASALQREFSPVYAKLGAPKRGDDFDRQDLRAELMGVLGMAKDPAVIAEAKKMAETAFSDGRQKGDVDPMITDKAILIAAANGDAALYDKVIALSRNSADPGEKSDALRTLATFKAPELVTRTMDYAVSGEVRNQDSWIPISMLLTDVDTREVAWSYITKNWEKVHAQLTTNSGSRIVSAAGNFCSAEKHDEVASFFATHKVDAAERTLAKALDSINDCVQLRAAQQPALHQWLTMQAR